MTRALRISFAAALLAAFAGACTTADDDGDKKKKSSSGNGGEAATTSSGPTTSSGGAGGVGGGTGATGGQAPESCDPFQPRVPAPEVLVLPNGIEAKLVAEIDAAQSSVDVACYQFNRQPIINALVNAKNRGVTVRAVLDADQYVNGNTKSQLQAAGIEVHDSPSKFTHFHAKFLVVDSKRLVLISGNFNDYSMFSERNYGVVDDAWDDVADMKAVFESDFSGAPLDLSCTRMVIVPENADQRIGGLINGAAQTLDLAIMYISDSGMMNAIKARKNAGVAVRVLLANPAWIDSNVATAQELQAAGIPTKYFMQLDLHAKLILTEGAAHVGSTNLSYTSLNDNREAAVFVTEPEGLQVIRAQFETDWAAGVNP
jgi:phosphatidylserine/phosphatidylglycerophosphate/cardiolipin synthase-like enzyme